VADQLIRFNTERIKKNLWTSNPVGEPVTIVQCMDDREEGTQIARTIQLESRRRKLDLKDFAVLYRTNAQSRALEEAFMKSAIPYEIVGGIRFYERKEIKDVLAYLRLLVNPDDEEGLMRVINYPARGIGEVTIERVQKYAARNSISLFESLNKIEHIDGLTERAKTGITQFRTLIDKYQTLRSQLNLSELARSLVDELGILTMFKEERTSESTARWENVQELLSAISEFYDEKSDATLESFLEEVALVSDIDSWKGEHNAVTLMTLHASKGLEFHVVFIAGLEEGLLPFYSNSIEPADLEEERRLFYVGITRAQKKLYITHTTLRYRFGDVTYPSESRFLPELGKENIEHVGIKSTRHKSSAALFEFDKSASLSRRSVRENKENESAFSDDPMPDYESESQEHFEIKRGLKVRHEIFGCGKVVEVNGKGDAQKAVIQFEGYGVKNLIVKYARLRSA
jgi:DNA helicase II / ATP-dependent DNA helicase PcrA